MTFADAVQHFAAFTGGKAGTAATGAPIMIGWINDQGAVPTFPEGTQAVQAAVSLVNQQLGGADGRPITLVSCFPLTETQGQSCADKFLNNSAIQLIIEGVAPIGSASFISTIGGKKTILEAGPITPNDAAAQNAYSIGAGSFGGESDATYIIDNLKAKSVGILGESDDPASVAVVKQLKTSLEKAGIKVTEATYTSTTSNLLPALTATGGNSNDAIYMNAVSPPNCIAAAKAAKQLDITKPIIGNSTCVTSAVKAALGDYPLWTTRWVTENPYLPNTTDVQAYDAVLQHYSDSNLGGTASDVFPTILVATKFINQLGASKLGTPAFSSALAAFTGPAPLDPPGLKYNSVKGLPALETTSAREYTYTGNGSWKDTSGWLNVG
jgi:branched-chain amino acid transport system substrate-binding protein